jgi:hypothetical protein
MKPPLWLLLHAAGASEQLFLLVTEPRSGSDWLVDLLDAHPNVCVPAGAWPEKHSGDKQSDKHSGVDGHALVGVSKANALNRSAAAVGAAYEDAAAYRLAHTRMPTSPKRVEDSIANLDDVRDVLRGTKWEI